MIGKKPKTTAILAVLLALNMALSGVVLTLLIVERRNESSLVDQYTLYIGTNDKDTNVLELSMEECKARVESVCMQYVSGYTLTEADGGWIDSAGNTVREKSLVCCINGATAAEIDAIVEELLTALNQSSILVEHTRLGAAYHER